MFNRRDLRRTKTLSLVIILSLQLNSVVQAATIAQPDCSQGKNPEVMKAANQTTVVNIRRPNAQGLSHNQYINLQVDKEGLIFNNSSEISKTQLAGFITGNKQLAGGTSANVILNEVTGNMPTNLNGYMEIAGNKASLVLANPNGLVGNNFGFINTNRAVLTTGIPYTDPLGKLDGFSVSGGSIAIEGAGLNAKDTAYTDIYAKAVKLNAGIWADNLNVITGSNKISYETGRIQEILDKKDQGISLDVAALGGMYAHRIALVGTAQGLGVNTAGKILADKLSVDQEGHVINSGKILSREELNVKAKADLLNQGELQSNGTVAIESGQGLTNLGKLQSNESMHIVAAKDFTNTGTIGSGARLSVNALHFANLKTIKSGTELNVFSQGSIQNMGNLYSGVATDIACRADLTNLGQINSTGIITINSQKAVYNKKLISGTTGVIITSTQDLINEDVMQSQGDLSLSSGANLRNEKLINGGKTVITANGMLHNAQGGRIYGDDLTLKAQTINNITEGKAPVIASRENLHLEADTINNQEHALLLSAGDMDIKVGTLNNKSASIEAGKNMLIQAGTIYNTNEHFATEMRTVQDEQIVEYQGSGYPHRYSAKGSGYTFDDKTIWPNGQRPNYDVYLFKDESLYLHTPTGDHEEWLKYEYRRVIKKPVIMISDPGKITSGGNLTLTGGKVINDKSQIIAGGALTAKVNELQNIEEIGKQYVEDVGLVHNYWRHERRGRDSTGHKQKKYKPVVAITDIQVQAGSYLGNTVATGSGVTAENKIDTDNGKQIGNIEDIGKGTTINFGPSSLFDVINNPTAAYYVETDPAFTNMQNWLSSDYFFKQINYDANKVAKRLGDGYYEQKIVRDQLMSLTGQRRVGDYASDEAQYKALLDNAVAFAKQSDAQVGVALTTQQQKELKNTLVWMVEKSVVLPNGEVVKALVPQVYVPQEKTAYGIRSTAVLAGRSIDVAVANDILNNGTIVATRGAAISAQNINNYSGKIQGSDILLKAQKDLNNVGGTLLADNSLTAQAGRDINMATTNTTSADVTGSKRTALNQIGGAYVTGDKGQMKLEAGRDLNLQAAEIVTEGKDSKAALSAGRDVNLSTTEAGSANTIAWDNKNYRKDASSQDIGTSVQAGGDLDIKAGRDFSAMGAYVAAEKKLKVEAGKNINIGAGHHKEQVEEHHMHKGKSGGGNSLTKTTDERLDGNYALGSTITGDKVSLQAGNDVNVTGSNVVGTNDVDIKAKGNVHITPAEESQKEKHFSKVEAKGIFGSGFGFVIGKQTTTEKQDVQSKMQAGSTVSSVTGNVNIAAGQNLQVEGSKVVAGKDINMSGAKVDVQAAEETYDSQYRYDYSLKGLSASLGGGIVDRGQKVLKSLERAHQAVDKRLSALYGVKVYQDAKNLTKDYKFNVNVGVSNYQEKETSDTSINTAKGSSVQAGGDVQIKAIEQDINIVGSGISGNKVSLEAAQTDKY
jgi:filamentous hemagglutinin